MKYIYINNDKVFDKPVLDPVFIDKDSLGQFTKISPSELKPKDWLSIVWSFLWRELVVLLLAMLTSFFIVGLIALGYARLAQFLGVPEFVVQNRLSLVSIVIFLTAFFAGQVLFFMSIFSNGLGKYHIWLVQKKNKSNK